MGGGEGGEGESVQGPPSFPTPSPGATARENSQRQPPRAPTGPAAQARPGHLASLSLFPPPLPPRRPAAHSADTAPRQEAVVGCSNDALGRARGGMSWALGDKGSTDSPTNPLAPPPRVPGIWGGSRGRRAPRGVRPARRGSMPRGRQPRGRQLLPLGHAGGEGGLACSRWARP